MLERSVNFSRDGSADPRVSTVNRGTICSSNSPRFHVDRRGLISKIKPAYNWPPRSETAEELSRTREKGRPKDGRFGENAPNEHRGRKEEKSVIGVSRGRPRPHDTRGKEPELHTMSLGRSFFSRVSYIRTGPSRVGTASRPRSSLLGNIQYIRVYTLVREATRFREEIEVPPLPDSENVLGTVVENREQP